jgi:hypothetical protein
VGNKRFILISVWRIINFGIHPRRGGSPAKDRRSRAIRSLTEDRGQNAKKDEDIIL